MHRQFGRHHLIVSIKKRRLKIVRSVIHDLVVLPEYKGIGIGKELVRRCIAHYQNSEWLVQTEKHIAPYYE